MSVRAPAYWRLVERAEARVLEAAVVVVAATVAATGVLVATAPHGLAVTPDSVHYLSAADSLRAGHGLIGFDGVPLTHFAPGFPVAVAAVWEVAASSMQSARILNALCLAWIVLCGWALLRRLVASPVLRLVGAAGLAVAPTLYTVSVTAWSEPLFIAIVLASVLTLTIGLDRERDWRWAGAAGFLAGASVSVRYAGLWLVATATLILLAAGWRSSTLRHRLQRAAVFFAGASVPLALVIERNLRLANEPFGSRGNPNLSVGQALSEIKVGIVRWFLPNGATSAVRVVFLAAIAVAALVSLATRTRSTAGPAADTRSSAGEGATPLWPFALLVTGYLAFLVVTAATESLDPIDRRLLSPAFALGVIFLVAAIDRLAKVRVPGRTWAAAGAVAAVAWLVGEVQTTASDLRIIHRDGVGFTGSYYRLSTVVAAIRERRIAPVYSDQTDALYFLTGVRSACWPTSAYVPCQDAQLDLRRAGNAKDVYVAWFVQPGEARPPVPTALRRQIRLVPLVTGANSGLYRVLLLHGHT